MTIALHRSILFLITILLLMACSGKNLATSYSYRQQALHRHWLNAIKDSTANFHQTVDAFKSYISSTPVKNGANKKVTQSFESPDDFFNLLEIVPNPNLLMDPNFEYEVKMFKGWYFDSQLWIKPDGKIATKFERQELINKQQEELKKIEKSQKKNNIE